MAKKFQLHESSLLSKVYNRLSAILLRITKNIIFSNSLRMWLYRDMMRMKMGQDCIIWGGNKFNDVSKFSMGNNVIIGPNNVFLIRGGIKIGDNVNISGFSFFISQEHDINDPFGHTSLKEIIVEDNSWIATGSTIMPGVKIGKGAVVASGSVVTKDVPNFTVVAGNPAKKIKMRSEDIRYRLNDTKGLKWL